jgi:hypothetical protein
MDRLRVLKDAVVPALSAHAWVELWTELRQTRQLALGLENRTEIRVH